MPTEFVNGTLEPTVSVTFKDRATLAASRGLLFSFHLAQLQLEGSSRPIFANSRLSKSNAWLDVTSLKVNRS